MMEVVAAAGAVRRAKLQSSRHHLQTNTQHFTGRMLFLSSNQQCQSTEGNASVIALCRQIIYCPKQLYSRH